MSGINKIVFGSETVLDLSSDTVSPQRLLRGYKAHAADGTPISGIYDPSGAGLIQKKITHNGTYLPAADRASGYSSVNVNVTGRYIKRLIEDNGTYNASDNGADGFSQVRVDVDGGGYVTTIDGVEQERDLDFISNSETLTLPYNFVGGSAVEYDDAPHILGGMYYETNHYELDDTSWTALSALPFNAYNGCALALNSKIHYLDGNSGFYYKWDGTRWTLISSSSTLPGTWSSKCSVVYNNEIHIIGVQSSASDLEHYKYNGSNWVLVSTLPSNIYYCDYATVCSGEIHVFSRFDGEHHVWNGFTWSSSVNVPNNDCDEASIVTYNNMIHILGGNRFRRRHIRLNGSSWENVSTLPCDYYRGDAIVLDNEIHIFGGYQTPRIHYIWDGTEWLAESITTYSLINS